MTSFAYKSIGYTCTRPGIKLRTSSTASCFDSINPTIPTHRTRGEKGVAIIWKNKLEHRMTIKPVTITSTRVCAVTLQGPSSRSCLINVYLPSRGRDQSDNELKEALDIVSQVKDSHIRDHNIFICGDFNASLHREDPNSHDKILNHFCKKELISLHANYPSAPTFFHSNGVDKATIDYFFHHQNNVSKLCDVTVISKGDSRVATNCSDHVPVFAKMPFVSKKFKKRCAHRRKNFSGLTQPPASIRGKSRSR